MNTAVDQLGPSLRYWEYQKHLYNFKASSAIYHLRGQSKRGDLEMKCHGTTIVIFSIASVTGAFKRRAHESLM